MLKNIVKKINFFLKTKKTFLFCLFCCSLAIIIDWYTKISAYIYIDSLARETNNISAYKEIMPFLNIVLTFNKGIAFGIFNSEFFLHFMPTILLILNTIIVLFVVYLLYKTDKYFIPYSFIIAGGLGNIIDRIIFGAVVDFIDFHIGSYHWPAFNLADSYICIGIFLYIVIDIKNNKNITNK